MTDLTHIWHKFDLLDGSRVTHAPNGLCQNDTVFLLHGRLLNRSETMVVKIGNCVSQSNLSPQCQWSIWVVIQLMFAHNTLQIA
jgi:hypothetical protein